MYSKSEEILIEKLQSGDESAYKELFDKYYERLCVSASCWLKDDYAAESVVGDVMFNIWRNREKLTIHLSLGAYLMRAVRNGCINYLKSAVIQRTIPLSKFNEQTDLLRIVSCVDESLTNGIDSQMIEQQINIAIDNLPEKTRQVFTMCRIQGQSYAEVSESLQISTNTVKYHITAAGKLMFEHLSRYITLLTLSCIITSA